VAQANNYGLEKTTDNNISTDFILKQKLDFLTEGLSVQGSMSYDTRFTYAGGIFEQGVGRTKYISPDIINKLPTESDWDYTYGNVKSTGMYPYVMSPPTYYAESIAAFGSGNNYFGQPMALLSAGCFTRSRQTIHAYLTNTTSVLLPL
jgi:hypothetical protein